LEVIMALESIFAGLDNNLPAGRIGTDIASAAVGAGGAAALGHFGVGGLEINPMTIGAGAVAGVVVSEAVRLVAVDEEKYLAARVEGLKKTQAPLSERLTKLNAEKAKAS
jgi:hypothetical protein